MILRDGKCYAENLEPVLKITGFETLAPHRMADADAFSRCNLDYETLTWLDGELDVAPEFVYENSERCLR